MGKSQRDIRVFLLEDDRDFIYLIRSLIEGSPGMEVCGYADNAAEGIRLVEELKPDVALVDLNLSNGELDGIEAGRQIRIHTMTKVLLLTAFDESDIIIRASRRAFASGYIFKSQLQILTDTILKTALGRTPQEIFIKELVLKELTNAERSVFNMMLGEAVEVHSSEKTIANQKTNIYKKLDLKNGQEIRHIFQDYG